MLTMERIEERVLGLAERKSDTVMNLQTLAPMIQNGLVRMKTRRGQEYGMVHNGQQSYLEKIGIPGGFFKKCNDENKRGVLDQFHSENGNKEVLIRKLDDNIRFIASDKYSCFDDKDMIKSLKDINMDLSIKEFHQDSGHTVLRVSQPDPINIPNARPFYPGLQIINSEIGFSSVKVQFFLWEEVCTNGMVAARGDFPMFTMRHVGKKDHERLSQAVSEKINGLPRFIEHCTSSLTELSLMDGREMKKRMESNEDIPKALHMAIPTYLGNYAESEDTATGLDYMSAFTEAAQKYTWDERLGLERTAGNLMLAVA